MLTPWCTPRQSGNRDKGGKQFGSCCGLFSPMSRRRESSVCAISIFWLSVGLLLMTGVKCQESFQREQYESLGGNAVLYFSHKEEGHSKISCFSLNMRAFVIQPSHRQPQGELCQGKRHHRGSKAKTGLVHSAGGD